MPPEYDMPTLAVVMDPIGAIKPYKDTTLAMLLEAQRRGFALHYFELNDLFLRQGVTVGRARRLTVRDDAQDWYTLSEATQELRLSEFDLVLMRKDPPFDMEYVYATYLLEQAERDGALVINRPDSLRDCNEKLFAQQFPHCCPPTLVSRDMAQLRQWAKTQGDIVLKPLDGMGGSAVFRLRHDDPNLSVAIEQLSALGTRSVMAQRYLPEIVDGDKRILMIHGEPVPFALARIPAAGESRGNLAAGGRGEGRPLTDRDRWICNQVGPTLRERGLWFVGLDVIGDYLTEINVTSPTCARELDAQFNLNIAGRFFDALTPTLTARRQR